MSTWRLVINSVKKYIEITPYTIIISHDTPQALAYVEKAKKLNFVKVTEIKEFEEEIQEQYELIMTLSKKTNRAIAHELDKARNLGLPFKN